MFYPMGEMGSIVDRYVRENLRPNHVEASLVSKVLVEQHLLGIPWP